MYDTKREEFLKRYNVTPEQREEMRKRNDNEKQQAEKRKKAESTGDSDPNIDQRQLEKEKSEKVH